jgi:hypothetical protein
MTPEVAAAVEEIRRTFPDHQVEVREEAQGGAYVVLHGVPLGDRYDPKVSWVGFLITFQYPHADVYPHFVAGKLSRIDKAPLGAGFSGPTEWQGLTAVQVSRRSNRWNAAVDTAAGKLLKVLEWVRSR